MCSGARLVTAHRGHMRAGGSGCRCGNGGPAVLDLVTAAATTTAATLAAVGATADAWVGATAMGAGAVEISGLAARGASPCAALRSAWRGALLRGPR
jgi:hypothetical protein